MKVNDQLHAPATLFSVPIG